MVQAVELDEDRVQDLRHNVQRVMDSCEGMHGGEVCRVRSYWSDYLSLSCDLAQDLVVLDPPWGGPGYTDQSGMTDLDLGGRKVSELAVHLLYFHAPLVVLRFPSKLDSKVS